MARQQRFRQAGVLADFEGFLEIVGKRLQSQTSGEGDKFLPVVWVPRAKSAFGDKGFGGIRMISNCRVRASGI